jgi:hypothetical protein
LTDAYCFYVALEIIQCGVGCDLQWHAVSTEFCENQANGSAVENVDTMVMSLGLNSVSRL